MKGLADGEFIKIASTEPAMKIAGRLVVLEVLPLKEARFNGAGDEDRRKAPVVYVQQTTAVMLQRSRR